MSCGFDFDHERKLIRMWGEDSLDLVQVLDVLRTAQAHAGFDPDYATMCDLRALTTWALEPQDLSVMVAELRSWDRRQGRTAIVVGENRAHRNLGETFARLADGTLNAPHQVFRDAVEAEVWLGVRDVMAALR